MGFFGKKDVSEQAWRKLTITKDFGEYIKFDEINRKWFIPDGFFGGVKNPVIYSFDDILDFELIEDGNSVTKGGIGRAVVGHVLAGGIGAIVGGITAKRKTKSTCTRLQIKITLNNITTPAVLVNLIISETKKDSFIYKTAYSSAQNIMSVLQIICANKQSTNQRTTVMPSMSFADEIIKYKQLFDQGIITQEEFNEKKRQLLDL